MEREKALDIAADHLSFIAKNQINTHFIHDSNYPRRLRNCIDAPLLLFSKGDFEVNPALTLAIVGTRAATPYGRKICEELVQRFSNIPVQIISGLAYGIDICAHELCLEHNIETIAILGHGLDRIYPNQHKKTVLKMLEKGGVLTEFLPGTSPDRENFPMRNRIVAGLADATIVVESKKTGGSLITAGLANDYNRDVFAFPGNIGNECSEGCNELIKLNGAQLVTSAQDILNFLGYSDEVSSNKTVQKQLFKDLSPEEEIICSALNNMESEHLDSLACRINLPITKLNACLLRLEMRGIVTALPGKKFQLN
jgi:DNA processing protein